MVVIKHIGISFGGIGMFISGAAEVVVMLAIQLAVYSISLAMALVVGFKVLKAMGLVG